MTLGGLGCPFTCEAAAFFLTQRRAQEARPGAASARLTAWGAPPFSGLPAWSPSSSPVGAGEDTRVGTAPAVSRRRWEKRRIFSAKPETWKQAGAKWSEQVAGRSLPRTKRPHSSRAARWLGKRNSEFPALVVLPHWAGKPGSPCPPNAPALLAATGARRSARELSAPRQSCFLPPPPATGSAELGPQSGRVPGSSTCASSSPQSPDRAGGRRESGTNFA